MTGIMSQPAETTPSSPLFVAFVHTRLLARGPLRSVAARCKEYQESGGIDRLAVFEDESARVRDLDLSGSLDEVLGRLPLECAPAESIKKRGRPKLGVVSREISLLPRHWDWLADQRGGASASLRRLIDQARKKDSGATLTKRAIEAAHRFMWDIAGQESGFEEASRELFAHRFDSFEKAIEHWPVDVREQLHLYVERARVAAETRA